MYEKPKQLRDVIRYLNEKKEVELADCVMDTIEDLGYMRGERDAMLSQLYPKEDKANDYPSVV